MEEYHRDSLREMRRLEQQGQTEAQKSKGSVFITLLIILLFLAAGGFYIKTEQPSWFSRSAVEQTLQSWKDDIAAVFSNQEAADVQQTVDSVLAEQNETV